MKRVKANNQIFFCAPPCLCTNCRAGHYCFQKSALFVPRCNVEHNQMIQEALTNTQRIVNMSLIILFLIVDLLQIRNGPHIHSGAFWSTSSYCSTIINFCPSRFTLVGWPCLTQDCEIQVSTLCPPVKWYQHQLRHCIALTTLKMHQNFHLTSQSSSYDNVIAFYFVSVNCLFHWLVRPF